MAQRKPEKKLWTRIAVLILAAIIFVGSVVIAFI